MVHLSQLLRGRDRSVGSSYAGKTSGFGETAMIGSSEFKPLRVAQRSWAAEAARKLVAVAAAR